MVWSIEHAVEAAFAALALAFWGSRAARGGAEDGNRPWRVAWGMAGLCALIALKGIIALSLLGGGLSFLISDDCCRWLMSWEWTQKPFFAPWDNYWLGGCFYFNGLAMKMFGDAALAVRVVGLAGVYAATIGLWLLALTLFDSYLAAFLAGLLFAAQAENNWIGFGALSEQWGMAGTFLAVGFIIRGIRGLRTASEKMAWGWIFAAALCVLLSTAFVYPAWFTTPLFSLALLAGVWRATKPGQRRTGLLLWAAASFLMGIYCIAWIADAWRVQGHFLGFMKALDEYKSTASLAERLLVYPMNFVRMLGPLGPLAACGALWAVFRAPRAPAPAFLLGLSAVWFATMVWNASGGTISVTPFRQTAVFCGIASILSAGLAPPAMAGLQRIFGRRLGRFSAAVAIALAITLWSPERLHALKEYHWYIENFPHDTIALGHALRLERFKPQLLAGHRSDQKIVVVHTREQREARLIFLYLAGDPSWISTAGEKNVGLYTAPEYSYAISTVDLERPDWPITASIGRYKFYRITQPAAASQPAASQPQAGEQAATSRVAAQGAPAEGKK